MYNSKFELRFIPEVQCICTFVCVILNDYLYCTMNLIQSSFVNKFTVNGAVDYYKSNTSITMKIKIYNHSCIPR